MADVEASTSVPTAPLGAEVAKLPPSLPPSDSATNPPHENGDSRMKEETRFSLRVKPEYVLTERDASLPPLVAPDDSRETGGGGRKKKRMRKIDDSHGLPKLCMSVIRGGDPSTCPYKDKCRFSHDLAEYMRVRPPDLPDLTCPNYQLYGRCPYGVACRLGSQHTTKEGMNVTKDGDVSTSDGPPPSTNLLSRDVQEQLRRNKYPFVCQRHRDNKKGPGADAAEDAPSRSFDPLPTKEVKLIDFSNKVYVAPLTTVGNLPFRRIMKKFGADITCGEMALCSNLLEGKVSEWALLKRHPSEDVFGVQLAAGYPDLFTRTCELIENHATVDFVDMNLGCPIDLICNKGSGACLMLRDKRLKDIVRGMTSTLSIPITIKMRTGWDTDSPIAHKLAAQISSWGAPANNVAAIMVHGRSRLQRYSKLADWDYVRRRVVPESPSIPVIGNGDIFSYVDYENKVLAPIDDGASESASSSPWTSGLSSCAMLARGALIKPWLPTEIKERRHWDISAAERLDILKDFVHFGLEHWGSDQQGVNNVRRFLLEWLSFLHRYVPVGMLEVLPQEMNHRAPPHLKGRNDLETLFLSSNSEDWVRISEMLLGPVPDGFRFEPKHKASG